MTVITVTAPAAIVAVAVAVTLFRDAPSGSEMVTVGVET